MRSFQLEKETGEKVRKGCEAGSAQEVSGFPCPLSATYLILPASSFLCCAFHGVRVPQQVLRATRRTCSLSSASRSGFTQHRVWVTFPDPVRIKFAQSQRLACHPCSPIPACLSRRWKQSLAITPGQFMKLLSLVWDEVSVCVCVDEAVIIHSQMGLLEQLHSPATSCTCRQSLPRGQLSYWTVAPLCSFLSSV